MPSDIPKKDKLKIRTVQITTFVLAVIFSVLKYTSLVAFSMPDYIIVGLYFVAFGIDPEILANLFPWSKK